MYSSLGYYDINPGSDEAKAAEKLPYRRRNRVVRVNPHEKWKEACLAINPDFDNLSESAKEIIESKLKVDYYIALSADSSLPRTATSGSIQTPRASPLVKRPPRVPSRAPSAPLFPTRQLPPIGPLPPLPLFPSLTLPAPVSPIPPLPPLSTLPPLPPLITNNPYLSSFYKEDNNLASLASTSTSNSSLLVDPFRIRKPPDPPSFYDPSTSNFSASRLADSTSSYVQSPFIYGTEHELFKNIANETNNNNDNTINNNDQPADQPFDYTFEALNQWNF